MRKILVITGIILMIAAIKPATAKYRTQISQYCGDQGRSGIQQEQTAHWLWDWWQYREGGGLIQCVGPAEYMNYRPLDVAAGMVLAGAGLTALGLRRKHG